MLQGYQAKGFAFGGLGFPPFFRERGEPLFLGEVGLDPLVESYTSTLGLSNANITKLDRMASWLRASGLLPNLVSWCEFSLDYNSPNQGVISFPSIVGPAYSSVNGGYTPEVSFTSDGYSVGDSNRWLEADLPTIANNATFIIKSDIQMSNQYLPRYRLMRTDATSGLQFNTFNDNSTIYPIISGVNHASVKFSTSGFQNVFIHTSGQTGVIYGDTKDVTADSTRSYSNVLLGWSQDETVQRRVLVFDKALNQSEREIVGALDTVAELADWESLDSAVVSYMASLSHNGAALDAYSRTFLDTLLKTWDTYHPRADIVRLMPLWAGSNIGSGTVAKAVYGSDGTLVNGPTWESRGVLCGFGMWVQETFSAVGTPWAVIDLFDVINNTGGVKDQTTANWRYRAGALGEVHAVWRPGANIWQLSTNGMTGSVDIGMPSKETFSVPDSGYKQVWSVQGHNGTQQFAADYWNTNYVTRNNTDNAVPLTGSQFGLPWNASRPTRPRLSMIVKNQPSQACLDAIRLHMLTLA